MAGPYSRGFKFGERVQSKFWSILPTGSRWLNYIKILSHFNTQSNTPRVSAAKFQACRAGPLLKGLQIWGKGADQNFGPFLPTGSRWLNFIKILSLFNTQPNRPTASPASFKHVGQASLLKGLQIWGKRADQNLGPFWPPGLQWLNLTKILSLFNTQPNRPRASPASSKHVGQVAYSWGFKFGEKGPIKILVHFCLQVGVG